MDSSPHHKSGHHHQPKSPSELFSSAKVLAEAAQATFSHGSVNKAKAAGAASDLLDATCQYGNLEDGKFGQYFEKAETYLHQYQSADHSSAAARCGGKTNAAAHGGGSGYGESDGGYDEQSYQSRTVPAGTGRYVPDLKETGTLTLQFRSGPNTGPYRSVPGISVNTGRDGLTGNSVRNFAQAFCAFCPFMRV